MIGRWGPKDIIKSIMYAEDGLHFKKTHDFTNKDVPLASGAYRPEAFSDSGNGQMIEWGLHKKWDGFLERFDLKEVKGNP